MPLTAANGDSRWRRWASRVDPALLMLMVGPLMICFAWVVTFTQIVKDRNRALAEGYREANGLSRSLAELTKHHLDDLDQVVRVVRSDYLSGARTRDVAQLLIDAGFRDSQMMTVGVLDASNRLVAGRAPVAPAWLASALPRGAAVPDQPTLSTPLAADRVRPDTLAFSRPVHRADGAFAGTVVVFVPPARILSNLRRLNVGLARQFGTIELRRDDIAAVLGADRRLRALLVGGNPVPVVGWPHGPVVYQTKTGEIRPMPNPDLDAVPRLWSGGYLREYDITIVVGTSLDVALRDFERHRNTYLAGTSAFTLAVGVLTLMAAVLARRQKRTLQRLALSERTANELKSSFLAKISHDLRTPLNGILGFSELVKTTAGEAEQRQYGEYIHDSATHLLDLVNMILDLTKLRNGTLRLQLRDVDLAEVAASVSRTHSIVAQGKGLEYRLSVAADFPGAVVCDGVRIREVMNNLLHNAIKFTHAGQVGMDLARNGDRAAIRVWDTGIGMTDEVKQHLFEPFSEGRDAASQAQAGAGLGLAFSRELVALHGGAIGIESTPGQGTAVTFWIPLSGPDAQHMPTVPPNEGTDDAARTDRG